MTRRAFAAAFLILIFLIPLPVQAQVIHEVKSGDTLTKISKQYGFDVKAVARLNGLKTNARLVVGQAILLQGSTYVVQPGDSIWEIAKRHSLTENQIKKANHLKNLVIKPGQRLTIPRPPKLDVWTGTYYLPKDKQGNEWMIGNYQKTLSGLFVFEYRPQFDGTLMELSENETHKIAWRKGLTPYATITNLDEKVGFNPELAHRLISKKQLRKQFINNIYQVLHTHDYKGVVIDFEQVRPGDRDHLNRFLKELSQKLHKANMEVMIAVPPKEGNNIPSYSAGYDYKAIGKYVDRIFIMTYDWHWPGGPSGPIAPIDRVKATLDYAVSVTPRSKLMMGIPQYAYDWTLSGEKRQGKAYSTQKAIDIYIEHESAVQYHEDFAAPTFRYVDKEGLLHEVWFEDARSLLAKFRLVKTYGLAGMGCWHLGLTTPQTEEILLEEFRIH
ncbi:LysM peptidoglycan-binding domain-containing protein [Cohnella pontilimi]|uniref:LysM peptidoglycan-binding domain-containing protein n=2 Tax=Cohnella pontilimi TaxID=2564100 RepID=A0A4U0FBM2_9BACL|nr:LysM peptidoglycan-binding domain-containing protein [Cohnella pontilimi]